MNLCLSKSLLARWKEALYSLCARANGKLVSSLKHILSYVRCGFIIIRHFIHTSWYDSTVNRLLIQICSPRNMIYSNALGESGGGDLFKAQFLKAGPFTGDKVRHSLLIRKQHRNSSNLISWDMPWIVVCSVRDSLSCRGVSTAGRGHGRTSLLYRPRGASAAYPLCN